LKIPKSSQLPSKRLINDLVAGLAESSSATTPVEELLGLPFLQPTK
jgi:hypothetical protein